MGWIPGSERDPGGGNGYPLQYSCSENSMDRRAWRAVVQVVTKSQTELRDFCFHFFSSSLWTLQIKNVPDIQIKNLLSQLTMNRFLRHAVNLSIVN